MMVLNLGFPIFMCFIGTMVFCLKCSHLLLMLLSLEFIVLFMSWFMLLYLFLWLWSVCKGALSLSILVSMIRSYGNNYFQSFNILW